jgi:sortase (surface protein transpeptidase)
MRHTATIGTTYVPENNSFVLPTSEPLELLIPRLGIQAPFEEPVRLLPDQTIGVPESTSAVAWYDGSPTPGTLGPSVVLGHVDSKNGPAVFYSLGQLHPGDVVKVVRKDGSTATFVVDKLARYPQDTFPTDAVYGPIAYAGIRLVTCSGVYDKTTQKYSHNLVIFGHLTAS